MLCRAQPVSVLSVTGLIPGQDLNPLYIRKEEAQEGPRKKHRLITFALFAETGLTRVQRNARFAVTL